MGITSVEVTDASKGGAKVDSLGGWQLCDKLNITMAIANNNYGTIADPKLQLKLYNCNKSFFGGCAWHASIANSLL